MKAERAVVIGASVGGLLAARILSERFERVTVLERDVLPAPGEPRKGVPHGRHAHGLLARGREIVEELFPGVTDELVGAGALLGDAGGDAGWFHEGGYHARRAHGITTVLVSRPLLEGALLRRVRALESVEIVERCDVLGLAVADGRVAGVRYVRRAAGAAEELAAADLTVDASGRGSRAPAWLEAAGYPRPEEEEVEIDVGYASRLYRRRPGELDGRAAVVVGASPGTTRPVAVLALEGDRWIVSLGGYLGDHPPLDVAGFAAFADGVAAPEVGALVRGAEPLTEPVPYRVRASVRRRYERCKRFPEGFLVLGDAVCAFNPVYGQGMTVAALEALALRACLARGDSGLARRFFREVARIVDVPWSISVVGDLRFPEVAGRRGVRVRLLNWYLPRLHRAAHADATVSGAFLRVANLLAPPSELLRPAILVRVLRATTRRTPARAPDEGAPSPAGTAHVAMDGASAHAPLPARAILRAKRR
jgi:2-polyprenyl-6-methoxyphenol hydroxylase-like FAD-dependent oxidoreductase